MDKIKVIFLDIDGVLNVYCESRDKYGCNFHPHFVDNLKHIIDETDAKIVISSSWKADGLITLKKMWIDRNLPGEVIDITEGRPDRKRGKEIQQWLDKHKEEIVDYVIIDDDDVKIKNKEHHFVKTSDNPDHEDCVDIGYGLTKECAEQAIILLNKTNITFEIDGISFIGRFTHFGFDDAIKYTQFSILLNKEEDVSFFKAWFNSKLSDERKNYNTKDVFYKSFYYVGKLYDSYPISMDNDNEVILISPRRTTTYYC